MVCDPARRVVHVKIRRDGVGEFADSESQRVTTVNILMNKFWLPRAREVPYIAVFEVGSGAPPLKKQNVAHRPASKWS